METDLLIDARKELKSKDPEERANALRTIAQYGEKSDVPAVLKLVSDPEVRIEAINCLLLLDDHTLTEKFDSLFDDTDSKFRAALALGLSHQKIISALPHETDKMVLFRLAQRLQLLGEVKEAEAIYQNLSNGDDELADLAQSMLSTLNEEDE